MCLFFWSLPSLPIITIKSEFRKCSPTRISTESEVSLGDDSFDASRLSCAIPRFETRTIVHQPTYYISIIYNIIISIDR